MLAVRLAGRLKKELTSLSLSLSLYSSFYYYLVILFFLFILFITIDNAIASTSASRDKNFSTLVSVHVTDIH